MLRFGLFLTKYAQKTLISPKPEFTRHGKNRNLHSKLGKEAYIG